MRLRDQAVCAAIASLPRGRAQGSQSGGITFIYKIIMGCKIKDFHIEHQIEEWSYKNNEFPFFIQISKYMKKPPIIGILKRTRVYHD